MGLGVPLGNGRVAEAGLYPAAGAKVSLIPQGGTIPGNHDLFKEPRVVPTRELAGVSNVLLCRNSQPGAVEVLACDGKGIELGST